MNKCISDLKNSHYQQYAGYKFSNTINKKQYNKIKTLGQGLAISPDKWTRQKNNRKNHLKQPKETQKINHI